MVASTTSYRCLACACDVPSAERSTHERGRKHANNSIRRGNSHDWCDVCECRVHATVRFMHERGKKHVKNVEKMESGLPYRCDVCACDVPGDRLEHERGTEHRANALRAAQTSAERSESWRASLSPSSITMDASTKVALVLKGVPQGESQHVFADALPGDGRARTMMHSLSRNVIVDVGVDGTIVFENAIRFRDGWYKDLPDGVYGLRVMLLYGALDDDESNHRSVMTTLSVHVQSCDETRKIERKILEPTRPYAHARVKLGTPDPEMVIKPPPSRAVQSAATKFTWPKPLSKPDNHVRAAVKGIEPASKDLVELIDDARKHLSKTNYSQFFRTLLMMEEIQMDTNMRVYDMENVLLEPCKGKSKSTFRILVPGLSESRPSVLRGDRILVTMKTTENVFRGEVDFVEAEHCVVRFANDITKHAMQGTTVNVRFELARSAIELLHGAIRESLRCPSYESFLLPSTLPSHSLPTGDEDRGSIQGTNGVTEAKILNRHLNDEQQLAVRSALAMRTNAPFIIFGPPGTGKTTTVVEIAAQMYRAGERVLIMAPSNAACDLFMSRVINEGGVPKSAAYRVYNFTRALESVPASLLDISNYDKNEKNFTSPTVKRLSEAKIVAMTPLCAQRLTRVYRDVVSYGEGGKKKEYVLSPENRFRNVIVDEAGHASEPEILAAIVNVLDPAHGRLILAGDARQLGPLVQCNKAKALEISMLERLCLPPAEYAQTPYSVREDGTFEPSRVCMLTKNYRSHASIIEIVSKRFYFGKLSTHAEVTRTHTFKGWDELPNPTFPVVFHGVSGEEMREASSPSWFNPDEILVAGDWISKILAHRGTGVTERDIAVVTPYHRQKLKMKKHLEGKNISGVTVGSTELLQGQEFSVVVITCTRSDVSHLAFDIHHRLGFMANPKRYNVAITRAKSLLIVIGNPFLLAHCEEWRALIDYCRMNDSYTGIDFDGKPSDDYLGSDEAIADVLDEVDRVRAERDEDASYERIDPRDHD